MSRSVTFQKRHFEFIARTIHTLYLSDSGKMQIARDFAGALSRTNPNFRREHFINVALTGDMTWSKRTRLYDEPETVDAQVGVVSSRDSAPSALPPAKRPLGSLGNCYRINTKNDK